MSLSLIYLHTNRCQYYIVCFTINNGHRGGVIFHLVLGKVIQIAITQLLMTLSEKFFNQNGL